MISRGRLIGILLDAGTNPKPSSLIKVLANDMILTGIIKFQRIINILFIFYFELRTVCLCTRITSRIYRCRREEEDLYGSINIMF